MESDHRGINMPQHLGDFFWPLPILQLSNRKGMSQHLRIGRFHPWPTIVIQSREFYRLYARQF